MSKHNSFVFGLILTFGAMGIATHEAKADKRNTVVKAKKKGTAPSLRTTPAKDAQSVKTKNMIFGDGDTLEAERFNPSGFELFAAKRARHGSLIRLRSHFIREVLKSADDL